MNAARRKMIAKAIELLDEAKGILESVKDEEQEAFDNLPESFQASERGETMEDNIYNLDEAYDSIEEIVDTIGEM